MRLKTGTVSNAKGPSMHRALTLFSLALFLPAFGCAETAADVQVRYAAAEDLECDESALQIVESRPYRKRVEGCGRTVTYVRSCPASGPSTSAWASRCQWLPSVEEPSADAPPPPSRTSETVSSETVSSETVTSEGETETEAFEDDPVD
jgi:hypothetical protein